MFVWRPPLRFFGEQLELGACEFTFDRSGMINQLIGVAG